MIKSSSKDQNMGSIESIDDIGPDEVHPKHPKHHPP